MGTSLLLVVVLGVVLWVQRGDGAQWCIARSEASEQALQAALDYACGLTPADCQPIQPGGPCYLPNTLLAHASYAFNSFYQRSRGASSDSCDFAGVATLTLTDPSYGSCTFPSSTSTSGGATTPTTGAPITNTPTAPPVTTTPTSPSTGPTTGGGNAGGLTPIGGLTPGTGGTTSGGNIGGLSPGTGQTPGTGGTTSGGNISGLTPVGGLMPGGGLTPGMGANSGTGTTGTMPDADYSGSSALLSSLLLIFASCLSFAANYIVMDPGEF